jgi:hypothetical protein
MTFIARLIIAAVLAEAFALVVLDWIALARAAMGGA